MMRLVEKLENSDSWNLEIMQIQRIANKAAYKARLENQKFGLSNIFSKNGVVYYELANGQITTKRPKFLEK